MKSNHPRLNFPSNGRYKFTVFNSPNVLYKNNSQNSQESFFDKVYQKRDCEFCEFF